MSGTGDRARIAVFGLGYVGCVSAACFADRGHEVIGVDVAPSKVRMVAEGRTPVVEERIGELIAEVVGVRARCAPPRTSPRPSPAPTSRSSASARRPTPPAASPPSTSSAWRSRSATPSRERDGRYTVVFRSTMMPGTCEDVLKPILEEHSGLRGGRGLRPGREPGVPARGLVGARLPRPAEDGRRPATTQASGDVVAGLYEGLPGPVHRVPIRVAEMTKYADNTFHALKVGFANEIGAICSALGVDSHEVMEIFRADTKLNISPRLPAARLRVRRLVPAEGPARPAARRPPHRHGRADPRRASSPRTSGVVERAFALVEARRQPARRHARACRSRPGTDDLRESPLVELAERLLGRGYDLLIHDAPRRPLAPAGREPRLRRRRASRTWSGSWPRRPRRWWRTARRSSWAPRRPRPSPRSAGAEDARVVDLVRFPGSDGARGGADVRRHRLVAEARGTHPRSWSRTSPCRSTGASGRRAARWSRPATRSRSSARAAPSATPSRTPCIEGVEIHRYPLEAATGGPLGYVKEYGAALCHSLRLAFRGSGASGRFDVDPRVQPAGPAVPGGAAVQGARHALPVRPPRPGAGAVRVAVRRARACSTRSSVVLERADVRAWPTCVISTNESYREVAIRRGQDGARATCTWCAARRTSRASRPCRRTPR